MKKYSRVSYGVRCQIYALMQAEVPIPEIATQLGYHKSTIYRELKRNRTLSSSAAYEWKYVPIRAQREFLKRKKRCRRKLKVDKKTGEKIKELLKLRWSPQIIAGRLKVEGVNEVSYQTIYRFVKQNPSYLCYLHFYDKRGFRKRFKKKEEKPKWWISIEKRPKVCEERRRIGDWERDTMIGRGRENSVLVCTDRKSRYTKVGLLGSLKTRLVAEKTIELIEETGRKAKTVTNDNGVEFRSAYRLPVRTYNCHPFSPQERGTVENTIGVIRRFYPKSSKLNDFDKEGIESWLNYRPRKVLNYRTPHEVYYNVKVALVT